VSTAGSQDESWFDDAAGQLVRPYAVTNGRTHPTAPLNLLSMVRATGRVAPGRLDPEHDQALELCHVPTSVAEVAAHLQQPMMVTKILLSDLIDWGAVTTRLPGPTANSTDRHTLEALLDGLRKQL
jgi:hypothetical protein